ncbi:MAG: metallophosphoesterase [Oscillospiraceae bacterium]|nr:metallophosphoesterase [Oscillospiraceae bacterium]
MENNSPKKNKRILLNTAAALAGAFVVLAAASFPMKTVYYTVHTDKISEAVRIAQVSDLHSCYYGKDMENLVNAIDETSPDMVVLTGDIYDDSADSGNTCTFLDRIGRKYPCYYVTGNHEQRNGSWDSFVREAESFGIHVLDGENTDAFGITLCGSGKNFSASIEKCAEEADTDKFNVLLAHYPEQIDYYRSFGKFDLILSGHAHGGQWRIPGILNGLYAPNQGLFPEYAGGRYDFDDSVMIVSRGLSRTKEIIPRIFNNPELVIVDIVPGDS